MSELKSITISRQEVRPFDYAAIREEAIGLVQKLSGKIWTDYNAHDPGVTILEQIVFTLTELGYKTGFDVADYLSDASGYIDYDSQAMYAPAYVTVRFPVTLEEYSAFFKKHLYCEDPNTHWRCYPEKVNFVIDENGFYKVEIFMSGTVNDWISGAIFTMFWRLWRRWRCMGDHVCDARIKWLGGHAKFEAYTDNQNNVEMPRGSHRDVADLEPIIDLFPTIYREGEGVEPLKKFLAPIEYVFKKFLSLVETFPQLFSVRNVDLDKILKNLEQYNSALDQMLAMYGVHFPQFNFVDLPKLTRCKVQFLRELPKLLQHRSGKAWRRRVELMLGIIHDSHDKLKIFDVDGVFASERPGRIHIIIFSENKMDECDADAVERFVCNEIPAHLLPVIYWAPKNECRAFAKLYVEWINDVPMKIITSPQVMNWLSSHKQCISKKIWL
jgi:hypothetical protein